MITVEHKTERRTEQHPVFGSINVIDMYCVDSVTGEQLSNEQIYKAFLALNIVNVHVKLRGDKLLKPDAKLWPGFGVITNIDDKYVYLNSIFEVPKQDFLEWYELD